jgi:ABC-type taurine transport system substrate-binding protein
MHRIRYWVVMLVLSLASQGVHAADPVNLVVGYQPYDTISYSAVVIRGLELWKKYLPPGSTVEFESALQGAIIVNAMLADKQQIGYLGDMPAVVSTTKAKQAKIKLVASTGLSAGQRCNVIMVRSDAPAFKSAEEAVTWLDGKVLATPRGSCADRFLRQVIEMKASSRRRSSTNRSRSSPRTSAPGASTQRPCGSPPSRASAISLVRALHAR